MGKLGKKRLQAIAKSWNDKENLVEGDKPSYSTGQF